uniref:Reverse transcriptase n=1 Tax=Cannabis sativa TaxID=3483 RepID=A0A803PER8_CANSA
MGDNMSGASMENGVFDQVGEGNIEELPLQFIEEASLELEADFEINIEVAKTGVRAKIFGSRPLAKGRVKQILTGVWSLKGKWRMKSRGNSSVIRAKVGEFLETDGVDNWTIARRSFLKLKDRADRAVNTQGIPNIQVNSTVSLEAQVGVPPVILKLRAEEHPMNRLELMEEITKKLNGPMLIEGVGPTENEHSLSSSDPKGLAASLGKCEIAPFTLGKESPKKDSSGSKKLRGRKLTNSKSKSVLEKAKVDDGNTEAGVDIVVTETLNFGFVCTVKDHAVMKMWYLLAIYGTPYDDCKSAFWDHLADTINSLDGPCALMGDLNVLLSKEDKLGGRVFTTQHALRWWSKNVYGECDNRIKELELELQTLRSKEAHEVDLLAEATVLLKLGEIWNRKESMWKQRSRELWLSHGDRNSSLFDAFTMVRRERNHIWNLKSSNGTLCSNEREIRAILNDYFKNLFSSNGNVSFKGLDSLINTSISSTENLLLTVVRDMEEIQSHVFQMHPLKAPGLDGFLGCFYQKCWSLVGDDVVRCIQQFFTTGVLEHGLNHSFICLTPKGVNLDSVDRFRPIALCNFVYKVIARIIA